MNAPKYVNQTLQSLLKLYVCNSPKEVETTKLGKTNVNLTVEKCAQILVKFVLKLLKSHVL